MHCIGLLSAVHHVFLEWSFDLCGYCYRCRYSVTTSTLFFTLATFHMHVAKVRCARAFMLFNLLLTLLIVILDFSGFAHRVDVGVILSHDSTHCNSRTLHDECGKSWQVLTRLSVSSSYEMPGGIADLVVMLSASCWQFTLIVCEYM
jgi:hypothetical protein